MPKPIPKTPAAPKPAGETFMLDHYYVVEKFVWSWWLFTSFKFVIEFLLIAPSKPPMTASPAKHAGMYEIIMYM